MEDPDLRPKLGLIVSLQREPAGEIEKVKNLGFETCQVSCWDMSLYTRDIAKKLREALEENGIVMTTLWAGFSGRHVWNFRDGPKLIGLVPPDKRKKRVEELKMASRFAEWVGVNSITTHVGFIPEDPNNSLYTSLIPLLRDVAEFLDDRGQSFWFETGQETPVTLLRTFEDVGAENLGVNFDPANLLMYGKANPVDALDIIGEYVRDVHAKDGEYPRSGYELGEEKPLGEGRVNFPALLTKLRDLGYSGSLTIEREISGPQQIIDIKRGKRYLEELIKRIYN
ncbi:sugar phosphate isomerase/epimerase [Candidatus Bathyarchaeota archaeon]|nr:sugar phosphate isomerase/epimerase [Candidatus Bathyarchaeota archaeon]